VFLIFQNFNFMLYYLLVKVSCQQSWYIFACPKQVYFVTILNDVIFYYGTVYAITENQNKGKTNKRRETNMKRFIGFLILAFALMTVVSWAEESEQKMACQDWDCGCVTGPHRADNVGNVPVHTYWHWKRGGCYPSHEDYLRRAAVDCNNKYPS